MLTTVLVVLNMGLIIKEVIRSTRYLVSWKKLT